MPARQKNVTISAVGGIRIKGLNRKRVAVTIVGTGPMVSGRGCGFHWTTFIVKRDEQH